MWYDIPHNRKTLKKKQHMIISIDAEKSVSQSSTSTHDKKS